MASKKTNEQTKENKTKFIDTKNRLVVARGQRIRVDEWVREVKRYKLCYKINESWEYNVQHG